MLPSMRNSELQVHKLSKAVLPFTQTQEPAPYTGVAEYNPKTNGKEEIMPLEVPPPLTLLKRQFHSMKRQLSPKRIKRLQGLIPNFSGNTSWSVLYAK